MKARPVIVHLQKITSDGGLLSVTLDLKTAIAFNAVGQPIIRADSAQALLDEFRAWGYEGSLAGLVAA